MPHALIVDDSAATLSALVELVSAEGFTTSAALTVDRAKVELSRQSPDIVLADLNLPDGTGMNLLDAVERSGASPAVVFITGQASVDTAVEALRRGVTDYLTKPLDVNRLREILSDVSRTGHIGEEIVELKATQRGTGRFAGIVGRSESILKLGELIGRIAPSSASVLVSGESGSGKEVVARTIHELSRRRHGPFVPVNCGAISPTLMESELFGHEKGSFTGAERRHKGYFEQATRGTLFLDEITEMPAELQVKLLRVLETSTFTRVGGEQSLSVDVRIVAASNRDVNEALEQGKLREDLYYRLKVFQLHLPPLRERPEDIPLLAQHFLDELERVEKEKKRFGDDALALMRGYRWPGNVRELRNVVQSGYILGAGRDHGRMPAAGTTRTCARDAVRGGGRRHGHGEARDHHRRRGAPADLRDAAAVRRRQDARGRNARHQPEDPLQPPARVREGRAHGRSRGGRRRRARRRR